MNRRAWCMLGLLSAGLGGAGCGDEAVEKPTPPDLRATVQGFESPRGQLTPEVVAEVLEAGLARFEVAFELGGFTFLPELLGGTEDAGQVEGELRSQRQGLAVGGSTVEGDGFMRVRHTCPGWEGGTTPNAADGQVNLTVNLSDTGIDPVIWGGFAACKWKLGEVEALLEPEVALYVGDAFNLEASTAGPMIFSLTDGLIELDGERFTEDLDLRLAETGLEVLVEVSSGQLVFAPTEQSLQIRDAGGAWSCDLEGRQCTRGDATISF